MVPPDESDAHPATVTATSIGVGIEPDEVKPPAAGMSQPSLLVRDPERYQIIAEHARGGIGRVLRATDRAFGRDVAVKELLEGTPVAELRFVREAIITSRLEHPNIVPVHEAGRWPDGRPFYVMKLVSGRPLRALIGEARTLADRLALLDRVVAVADAIAYAHDHGVIHRDLKPANIIVGEYGETIVIDWGLAKYVSDPDRDGAGEASPEPPALELTRAGAVMGTPAYMAPEQASGGKVTERSDVYSLGTILLNVLGGRAVPAPSPPVASSDSADASTDTAGDRAAAGPQGLDAGIAPDLRSIIARAMAADPTDRYPSAKAFGDDLRRWIAGQTVAAHRYSGRERTARWLGAHRRLVQGAIAVLVTLLVASVWFIARESRLRSAAESSRLAAEKSRLAADASRRSAESERDRADRTSLDLLEQQGRVELEAGRPFRAAPFLAEAYRRDPGNLRVRWMLSEALRALDSLTVTFNVTPPATDAHIQDRSTYTVSLSPDDTELVVGQDTSAGFWDPSTGTRRRRLPLPWIQNLTRYSSDGGKLLVVAAGGSGNSAARMVDASTGSELAAVPVGEDAMFVTWSADGRYVVSNYASGRTDVWSVSPRPARLFSFATAPRPVFGSLAITSDGSLVAARGVSEIILADPKTGRLRRLPTPGEDPEQLRFDPGAHRLLSLMDDRSVRIWDVATGRTLGKLRQLPLLPSVALFSSDGSMVATTDQVAIHLWDASTTVPLASLDVRTGDGTVSAVFAHAAPRLVTTTVPGQVRTWDLPLDRWAILLPGHRGRVRGRYLADGVRLLTLDEDESEGSGLLRVWNSGSGQVEHSSLVKWDPDVDIDLSPDGRRLLLAGADGRAIVVDVASGHVLFTLATSKADQVADLAFSHDGRRIATAQRNGRVRFWSAENGAPEMVKIEWKEQSFLTVEFSLDDRQVVTAADGKSLRIWDSTTGELIRKVPTSQTNNAIYSPDGRRILTGGYGGDNPPRIFDATTDQVLAELAGSSGANLCIAFSPDGKLVATADYDGAIRILDASTGDLLRTMDGPTQTRLAQFVFKAETVEFSPDGKHLLATGPAYALVWNVALDTRSPAEVDAVVAAKSPWQLVGGKLKLRPR